MVLARAMSRRVTRRVARVVSCCVAFCMRRPKWAFCRSLISVCSAATSLLRSSAAFEVLVLAATSFFLRVAIVFSSGSELAGDEGRAQRQLGSRQAEGLACQFLGNADDLVDHLAGLDFGDVVLGVALAVTHPHFGGLVGDRLVGKHANPDAAAALDVTRDG